MWWLILFLVLGLLFLIKGADWLVEGASVLAKKYNISDLAIGLTIVAFGTSAPELVVNAFASYHHHPDIVFGNVIGSNNFNLFVILGITGLIYPMTVQNSTLWKEIPMSLLAAIILFIFANPFLSNSEILSRAEGFILFAFFIFFLYYVYHQLKSEPTTEIVAIKMSTFKMWSFIILGLTGLIIGGKLVVNNAVDMARILGISEKIIGLTIVAAGTSLPELATSLVAALKKNNDIAIGNIIGSNIFNILLILSISSFINPITYSSGFNIDMYLLIGGTLFLFGAIFIGRKKGMNRGIALILLIVYLAYTIYLINNEI